MPRAWICRSTIDRAPCGRSRRRLGPRALAPDRLAGASAGDATAATPAWPRRGRAGRASGCCRSPASGGWRAADSSPSRQSATPSQKWNSWLASARATSRANNSRARAPVVARARRHARDRRSGTADTVSSAARRRRVASASAAAALASVGLGEIGEGAGVSGVAGEDALEGALGVRRGRRGEGRSRRACCSAPANPGSRRTLSAAQA